MTTSGDRQPRADSSRDRGMTLTEMLITVTITGVITAVLAAAITTFLRNEGSVSQRLDQTRGLQQLVNYFPGDVASARSITVDPGDGACGTGGTVVVHLSWDEEFGGSILRGEATYRSFGGDETRLTRFGCDNDPDAPDTHIVVARGYSLVDVDDTAFSNGTVTLTLEFSGVRRTVTAQSRNITAES